VKRVLTAAVLIPLVVALLFRAPNRSVRLALAFVALLCLSEFLKLAASYQAQPMRLVAYLAGAWVVAAPEAVGAPFFLGITMLAMTLAMRGGRPLESSLPSVAATVAGVVYTAVPFRLAADLHARQDGPHWFFYLLVVNWVGDSAAYIAGKAFGRWKMAPTISPNKTWEGAVASLVVGAALGALYLRYFLTAPPVWPVAAGLSVVVSIAAQVGDLAESALKRGAGVKDSGSILPGHGGILDRVDGLLFSVPIVYWAVFR
jgi:phosphatidate cytidylyltransferase